MRLEILSLRNVSISSLHQAFTDLVRWRGRFYCVFREGTAHASYDGRCVVLASDDLERWEVASVLAGGKYPDIRDPKFLPTDDALFVYCPAWNHPAPDDLRFDGEHRLSVMSHTQDSRHWAGVTPVYEPGWAFWRPILHDHGYFVAANHLGKDRRDGEERCVSLLRSEDGRTWEHVSDIRRGEGSNETALCALEDGRLVALVRREFRPKGSPLPLPDVLAFAEPPYAEWQCTELDRVIQGPNICRLGNRLIAGGRTYGGPYSDLIPHAAQMTLLELDLEEKTTRTIAYLPSWGDCSYPGFLPLSDEELAVSYYSSHEGRSQVYVGRVRLRWEV